MINFNISKKLDSVKSISNEVNFKGNLCLDTRKYKAGEAFLAITGEKYNAVEFLDGILDLGCPLVIYTSNQKNNEIVKPLKQKNSETLFIETSDSIKYFQELMSNHLSEWENSGGKAIVISGSNGKTTTKEMLAFILSEVSGGKVVKTLSNNNNHIGVPLTINDLKEDTKYLVLELGSNHPGEMEVLCNICEPKIAYVTNIGETHLKFFDSLENVFLEESTCYDFVKRSENPAFFKNTNDNFLKNLDDDFSITLGSDQANDYQILDSHDKAQIKFQNQSFTILNSHLTGKHNFFNLSVASIIASKVSGKNIESIIDLAQKFTPTENRSQWISIGDSKVFLDAYNANPSSMICSLEGFIDQVNGTKESLFILGDMNELGEYTAEGHKKVAQFLKDSGCENIRYIGRYAKHYLNGYNATHVESYSNVDDYKLPFNEKDIKSFKYVFIKGSRSLQLECLIDIK